MPEGQLQLAIGPQEFFHDRVSKAVETLKIKITNDVEFYIVNLLCEFIGTENLKQPDTDIDPLQTPLALMYKQALESSPHDQMKIYKKMGDTSLYFAGFFQDYFNRKTFDIGYYITMGQTAYSQVSLLMRDRMNDDHFTAVYADLSEKFGTLVDVVAEVSDTRPPGERAVDILAIYDRWNRSHSDRLRRILQEVGIDPIKTPTKIAQ
jgi:hypothetical protein